jgi:phage terminase large subunit-like protein
MSLIIAEANNGGAVNRKRTQGRAAGAEGAAGACVAGQNARAEPIALKFEAGKAFFARDSSELEVEHGGMAAGGGYEGREIA